MPSRSPLCAYSPKLRLAFLNRPVGATGMGCRGSVRGCLSCSSPSFGAPSGGAAGSGISGTHGGTIGTPDGDPLLDCDVPTSPPLFDRTLNRFDYIVIFFPS